MKTLDIAAKDLLRSFRSMFIVFMMFILPIATVALFYVAFSGLSMDGGGFNVPVTRVQVVNRDQPAPQLGGFSAGQTLVDVLSSEQLADLLQVQAANDEATARAAVDNREAGVAVLIPSDFTAAALSPAGTASITLYQDPTLTLGPAIVKGLVSQFVDGFNGALIANSVVGSQLEQRGMAVGASARQGVINSYAAWAQAWGQSQSEGNAPALLVQAPPSKAVQVDMKARIMAGLMTGMLIFYAFFTGAATAESIIREDEEETLPRLFTTPTSRTAILGGKFLAIFLTIIVQVIVTMAAGRVIFGVNWGQPLPVALATVGLVVVAAGFGLFLMSFLKNTRQTGPVMGGVMTLTAMAGGLFTTGFSRLPAAFDTVALFTPQGWVLRAWKVALAGGSVSDMLPPTAVVLGMGLILFAVGAVVFRRRYA